MTERHESLQQAAVAVGGESYQQLREAVENNEARAAWKGSAARSRDLVQTYHDLKNDPRYTEEYKSEQA